MTLRIRPYLEDDEYAVVTLWREVFPDSPQWNDPRLDARRKLSVQRELFLVALLGRTLVGTVMGGYDGHRGWVYYVAVMPSHRKLGIGRALMERIEKELPAREKRIAAIESCTRCGECEDRCPYGLPVMDMLQSVVPAMRDMVTIYHDLLSAQRS